MIGRIGFLHVKRVDIFLRCLHSVKVDDSICVGLNFDVVDVACKCFLLSSFIRSVAPVPLGRCLETPFGALFQLKFPLLDESNFIVSVPGPPVSPGEVGDAIK